MMNPQHPPNERSMGALAGMMGGGEQRPPADLTASTIDKREKAADFMSTWIKRNSFYPDDGSLGSLREGESGSLHEDEGLDHGDGDEGGHGDDDDDGSISSGFSDERGDEDDGDSSIESGFSNFSSSDRTEERPAVGEVYADDDDDIDYGSLAPEEEEVEDDEASIESGFSDATKERPAGIPVAVGVTHDMSQVSLDDNNPAAPPLLNAHLRPKSYHAAPGGGRPNSFHGNLKSNLKPSSFHGGGSGRGRSNSAATTLPATAPGILKKKGTTSFHGSTPRRKSSFYDDGGGGGPGRAAGGGTSTSFHGHHARKLSLGGQPLPLKSNLKQSSFHGGHAPGVPGGGGGVGGGAKGKSFQSLHSSGASNRRVSFHGDHDGGGGGGSRRVSWNDDHAPTADEMAQLQELRRRQQEALALAEKIRAQQNRLAELQRQKEEKEQRKRERQRKKLERQQREKGEREQQREVREKKKERQKRQPPRSNSPDVLRALAGDWGAAAATGATSFHTERSRSASPPRAFRSMHQPRQRRRESSQRPPPPPQEPRPLSQEEALKQLLRNSEANEGSSFYSRAEADEGGTSFYSGASGARPDGTSFHSQASAFSGRSQSHSPRGRRGSQFSGSGGQPKSFHTAATETSVRMTDDDDLKTLRQKRQEALSHKLRRGGRTGESQSFHQGRMKIEPLPADLEAKIKRKTFHAREKPPPSPPQPSKLEQKLRQRPVEEPRRPPDMTTLEPRRRQQRTEPPAGPEFKAGPKGMTASNLPWRDRRGLVGRYTGQVNELREPHGTGVVIYEDGSMETGEWRAGMPKSSGEGRNAPRGDTERDARRDKDRSRRKEREDRPPASFHRPDAQASRRRQTEPEPWNPQEESDDESTATRLDEAPRLEIGDRGSPSDMVAESSVRQTESLQKHDFAFILRSDGETWTYALVAERGETKLKFVVDQVGGTKVLGRKHWGTRIRLAGARTNGANGDAGGKRKMGRGPGSEVKKQRSF